MLSLALRNRAERNVGKLGAVILAVYHTMDTAVCIWTLAVKAGSRNLLEMVLTPSKWTTTTKRLMIGASLHAAYAASFTALAVLHKGEVKGFL
mmetsp:Transcript_21370/g.31792  ORF Transcript_21370/g.31792 Transcript_21370/m.31792 type:complete len:93 (+) Transcript_21370:17-295(+)